jgi:hypothetical protein
LHGMLPLREPDRAAARTKETGGQQSALPSEDQNLLRSIFEKISFS